MKEPDFLYEKPVGVFKSDPKLTATLIKFLIESENFEKYYEAVKMCLDTKKTAPVFILAVGNEQDINEVIYVPLTINKKGRPSFMLRGTEIDFKMEKNMKWFLERAYKEAWKLKAKVEFNNERKKSGRFPAASSDEL